MAGENLVGYDFLSQNCLINLNPAECGYLQLVISKMVSKSYEVSKIATSQLEQPKINLVAILLLAKFINYSYSISI
jgi:hypothetical protein